MKKLIALVLALAMVLMIGAAFADPAATPTNSRTADTTVQITNLVEGDSVMLYKVIEWSSSGYWAPTTDFTAAQGATTVGLTQADVDAIVGQNHADGTLTTASGLNETYINKIISVTGATAVNGPTAVGNTGVYSYTAPAAGLFYAVVTPKDGTRIYKPIMVSADYSSGNTTNVIETSTAKYETVTIDKHATSQQHNHDASADYSTNNSLATDANSFNTVNVGDEVGFEINTTIPKFPVSFTSPVFKVSDTLTHMSLKANSITVYAGNTPLTLGDQYTLNATPSPKTFIVEFDADYIKGLSAAQAIKVTYTAIVDDEAASNINMKENTAEVNFSNNPGDTVGANKLVDETRHYTFSINGNVKGNRTGTDLIKVGIDKDGNELTATVELPNAHWAGALQGATFQLWDNEGKSGTAIRTGLTSDAEGQIQITGLDAGTYWLEELSAPEGFIKNPNLAKVEIIPVFEKKTVAAHTETINSITVTVPAYSYAVLQSYTIKINNVITSTYTVENEGTIAANGDDQIAAGSSNGHPSTDTIGKIQNRQGVELPSTGGIGTTIFYIVGGLLVIGAAVILVARRKSHE